MKLAVYLPALNEAHTLGGVLDSLPRAIPGITVGIDADGQFSASDIPRLIAPILAGDAEVVLCTRFGPHSTLVGSMPWTKRFGNWLLCRIISVTAEQRFTDVSCGFRAFTREAAIQVDVHSDFEYIHESLLTWHRFGQRVVEVELPVHARRETGESRVVSSVTRYGLRAGPVLIGALRDYSPLKFFGTLALLAFVPAVLLGGVALLADLIARLKFQVEEVLHESRRARGPRAGADERLNPVRDATIVKETVRYRRTPQDSA